MKYRLSIIWLIVIFASTTQAQVPNAQWLKGAGGTGDDYSESIAVDTARNIYVTGYFTSAEISFGTDTLWNPNSPVPAMYLAKYDSNGTSVWARGVVGMRLGIQGLGVAVDKAGNSYVTGSFRSDTTVFGTDTVTADGSQYMFLIKYDASGNFVWVRIAGGGGMLTGRSVAVDGAGNAYVTGNLNVPTVFGTDTLQTIVGNDNIFIVKYSPNGDVLWAKSAGSPFADYSAGIATDASGDCYITGAFWGRTITFGTVTLTNYYESELFLVKYDANGNVLWAKNGVGTSEGQAVAVDKSGNSYVTGFYMGSTFSIGTTSLNNVGGEDMFLAKYDSSGNVVWAKCAGGADDEFGTSVAVDAYQNSYVTGLYQSSQLVFGMDTLGKGGFFDLFLTKFDSRGDVIWAKTEQGSVSFAGAGPAVGVDKSGYSYVTGGFTDASIAFDNRSIVNNGSTDIFTARVDTSSVITFHLSVMKGWNMVSLPLVVADDAKTALYPTAISPAFGYDNNYILSAALQVGKGYWLKFDSDQNVPISGLLLPNDTIPVKAGWNMIGTLSTSILPANVGSIPPGILSSKFFTYGTIYYIATTLQPGLSYWVKVSEDGKLVLSASGNIPSSMKLRMTLSGETPPAPPSGEEAGSVMKPVPTEFRLDQCYPNPFNPSATIHFELPRDSHVHLDLYNLLGQPVLQILDEKRPAGVYDVKANAGNLSSGIYFYRLAAGTFVQTKKMVLLK